LAVYVLWTTMALLMNSELRKNWRLLLAVPAAPLYTLVFSFFTTFTGVMNDAFLFGNITKFAPESTLIKGDSRRMAVAARVRRAAILAVRAVVYGDVPFGAFWFGWGETPWTPSGYAGWTTNKKPTLYERLRFGAVPQASVMTEAPLFTPLAPDLPAVAAPLSVRTMTLVPRRPQDEDPLRRAPSSPPTQVVTEQAA
jgi:hypothetical protein